MSSLQTSYSESDRRLEIAIQGRFDFNLHKPFREAYKNRPSDIEYVVDLGRAEYMDSSALGMLLLLKEHAGGDSARVSLAGANEEIRKILAISNFDRLFRLV